MYIRLLEDLPCNIVGTVVKAIPHDDYSLVFHNDCGELTYVFMYEEGVVFEYVDVTEEM